MAEKVLKIKTLSEVAEAISGLTDLQGSLKGVGTAAFEAAGKSKAEWKALEAELAKTTGTAKGMAEQAFKVESALNAMGRASSQSQLESSLVKSQIEFRRLQSTIREVAATGGTIDDGVVSSMNVMKASIDAGKAKLNELKNTTAEAKRELGLLGKEGEKAGAAVSGAAGSTTKFGDAMRKQTEGINKFRGAAMETWAVLQLGKQAGEALAGAIDKQSAAMAAHDKKMNDAAVNTIKFQAAMRLARQGLIDIGGPQDEFLARYDAYIAKTSPAVKATEAQTKALKDQKQALDDLGKQMDASGKSVSFTINAPKIEEVFPLEEATKYAERLNDILGKAFKEGGAAERDEWAAANVETIEKVIASYERWGQEVPPHVKAAYDAMKAVSVDWIAQLDRENAAADAAYQAKIQRWAKEDAAANRTSKAPEEYKRIQDAAFGAAVANGELGTNLDMVAKAVVATGGTMVVGAPIWIQIAQATREAKDEVLALADAYGTLSEAQTKALTAADGWMDYLANLKEAHEGGTLSLTTYISLLSQFRTQIQRMFANVTGEAADAVRGLEEAVQSLINTAGASGGPVDNSYKGKFQRDFNKKKGKK